MTVQPVYWGAETLANTITASQQGQPAITALLGGGFVVAWTDYSGTAPDTSGSAVRAQLYDALGVKVGTEILVETATIGNQDGASIVALPDGGFNIIYNTPAINTQIVFQQFDGIGTKVGGEIGVSAGGFLDAQASTANLDSGGFAAVWLESDSVDFEITMRRFDATNAPLGTPITVNTTITGSQDQPDIAALGNGRFVVTWEDYSASPDDTSGTTIRMQIYNDDGTKVGGETLVPTSLTGDQSNPSVIGTGNGNFVVAWTDKNGLDGDLSGSFAQMFDQNGAKIGSEFKLNTVTIGDQNNTSLTALQGGGFFAIWVNGADISGQAYAADGTPIGGEINGNQGTSGVNFGEGPAATTLADGRVVVAYGNTDGVNTFGISVQILDPRGGSNQWHEQRRDDHRFERRRHCR